MKMKPFPIKSAILWIALGLFLSSSLAAEIRTHAGLRNRTFAASRHASRDVFTTPDSISQLADQAIEEVKDDDDEEIRAHRTLPLSTSLAFGSALGHACRPCPDELIASPAYLRALRHTVLRL